MPSKRDRDTVLSPSMFPSICPSNVGPEEYFVVVVVVVCLLWHFPLPMNSLCNHLLCFFTCCKTLETLVRIRV